jgi:hypothetical protein
MGAIRPHDIDFALFVHVLGAMALVGAVITSAGAAFIGWRDVTPRLRRFSYLPLLTVALPGWIIMRVGAEWTYSKEHLDKLPKSPTWLGIGYTVADGGGVLLLLALILGGIGYRRGRDGLLKASAVLAAILVVAYLVAVWAMGGKPS